MELRTMLLIEVFKKYIVSSTKRAGFIWNDMLVSGSKDF